MGYSRFFFRQDTRRKEQDKHASALARCDEKGRIHVALFSDLFGKQAENAMWTNAVFTKLREDIENPVALCPIRQQVVLDVYSPQLASEIDRERLLIAFRRYLEACEKGQRRKNLNSLLLFSCFLLIGILMIFVLYQFLQTLIPVWINVLLEIIATVFIWQFVGYMAFEFPPERRRLHRLHQIINITYEFHEWD